MRRVGEPSCRVENPGCIKFVQARPFKVGESTAAAACSGWQPKIGSLFCPANQTITALNAQSLQLGTEGFWL
jgi:hypothetical protein